MNHKNLAKIGFFYTFLNKFNFKLFEIEKQFSFSLFIVLVFLNDKQKHNILVFLLFFMIFSFVTECWNRRVQKEIGYISQDKKLSLNPDKAVFKTIKEAELVIDISDIHGIIHPLVVGRNGVIQRNKISLACAYNVDLIIRPRTQINFHNSNLQITTRGECSAWSSRMWTTGD